MLSWIWRSVQLQPSEHAPREAARERYEQRDAEHPGLRADRESPPVDPRAREIGGEIDVELGVRAPRRVGLRRLPVIAARERFDQPPVAADRLECGCPQ